MTFWKISLNFLQKYNSVTGAKTAKSIVYSVLLVTSDNIHDIGQHVTPCLHVVIEIRWIQLFCLKKEYSAIDLYSIKMIPAKKKKNWEIHLDEDEPMMISLQTHICVTRPQWVKCDPALVLKPALLGYMSSWPFIWHCTFIWNITAYIGGWTQMDDVAIVMLIHCIYSFTAMCINCKSWRHMCW